MSELFLLSERQLARISPFFPLSHGVPRVDDRRVISGIVYVIKHGLQWTDAPKAYGPHKTLYNRFVRLNPAEPARPSLDPIAATAADALISMVSLHDRLRKALSRTQTRHEKSGKTLLRIRAHRSRTKTRCASPISNASARYRLRKALSVQNRGTVRMCPDGSASAHQTAASSR